MSGIIIAGFSGIGKTTLGKKYKNVVDLDSAEFAYDDSGLEHLSLEQRKGMKRKMNPDWPLNYIDKIKSLLELYDYILVWDRPDVLKEYDKNNISYCVCYPDKGALEIYKERYRKRGNSEFYINKKINQYYENMRIYEKSNIKKIILFGNETLEDYLLKNGENLII